MVAIWQRGGWIGVDLFFVLSGFLISGLLFGEYVKRKRIHVGLFLVRRGFKIYPAFWCLLAVAVFVTRLVGGGWPEPMAMVRELLFVQNYWPGLLDHSWSLAVEEHFYILLPLLLQFMCRRGAPPDPFSGIERFTWATMLVVLTMRILYCASGRYEFVPAATASHLRVDGLLFGVLLGYWYHFKGSSLSAFVRDHKHLLYFAALAAFVVGFGCSREWPFTHTIGFTVLTLGFGALLLLLIFHSVPRQGAARLAWVVLGFVGAHSYSIYLWHRLLQRAAYWLCRNWLTAHWVVDVGVYFGLCLAGGIVVAKIIEFPVLRVRDRLFPSRSPALLTPPNVDSAPSVIA
jgi:peptidoglycan/LPS O-acetylase OafA/YrhL